MTQDEVLKLNAIYCEASAGKASPDYAVIAVPGLGMVELKRGAIMQVEGRDATIEEWEQLRDYLKSMKEKNAPANPGSA